MLGAVSMNCTIIQSSPLGRLLLRATPRGLAGLRMLDHDADFDATDLSLEVCEETGSLTALVKKVQQVIAGKLPAWKAPLDVEGPPFLKRVWRALVRVPWGETVSYEELARRAGRPRAVRAAASACARNPVCFIIPCHRVLAKGGGLGGYGYGVEVKRRLLQREGVEVG